MSCGVPVIGTNVYGIKQIIKNNENGYLCETSMESIRETIKKVLALEKPVSGRKTIIESFSLNKIIEKEIKIYDKILAS